MTAAAKKAELADVERLALTVFALEAQLSSGGDDDSEVILPHGAWRMLVVLAAKAAPTHALPLLLRDEKLRKAVAP